MRPNYGIAHEILTLIQYKLGILKAYMSFSDVRDLSFGLSLLPLQYILYARREGSLKTGLVHLLVYAFAAHRGNK